MFKFSPKASKYVSGIAVHWYIDFVINPNVFDMTHNAFPDKFIFGSEACAGSIPPAPHVILGSFGRAESYARDIIQVGLEPIPLSLFL